MLSDEARPGLPVEQVHQRRVGGDGDALSRAGQDALPERAHDRQRAGLRAQAPVHLLVVPKTEQYANVVELAAGAPELLAQIVAVANDLAAEHSNGEFRLVFNSGESAGQTVFHLHFHVLGGTVRGMPA